MSNIFKKNKIKIFKKFVKKTKFLDFMINKIYNNLTFLKGQFHALRNKSSAFKT
jgi:hypothetical protein